MGKGLEEHYVIRGNKKLHFGYTTGSCAAAAAKGAVHMLLGRAILSHVSLMTPKGILLELDLLEAELEPDSASCGVRKDAGDDPDTTDGLVICAKAEKKKTPGIALEGGEGVGRMTKPGLSCAVGEAAINPVPRQMILDAASEAIQKYGYDGGLTITIFVPGGAEAAEKTFNPRLGIVGGISILGTSGIVEPMSEKALVESIRVEMRQRLCMGNRYILATPGNYGETYLKQKMALPFSRHIKCSNYVGETIDMAIELGAEGILFVAHIGKFIKVAGGIMNTHSHSADSRLELFAANAIRVGADADCARKILSCNTTDEALEILQDAGLMEKTMEEILERIQFYLDHRSYEQIKTGAVLFSNVFGYLGQTRDAAELIRALSEARTEIV